jgi:hypothetical protein
MADDTWIGLGAATGRLYFDSSPSPNEMRLVLMDLDLNNNDIVFDTDGDTYIHSTADDVVTLMLATAAGEFEININGNEDFNFQADTFNVLVGSHVEMADDAWIGFTAGGQLVWDSTPAVDEIRVVTANLDLNNNDLILDSDGDTYLHASADNVIDLILAGAAGEFAININGVEDFTFTANSLNVLAGSAILLSTSTSLINFGDADSYLYERADDIVNLTLAGASGEFEITINGSEDFNFQADTLNVLAGSHVEMGDDCYIGFTGGGRIVFDSTPATDLLTFSDCTVTFGSYGLGIIHSSAGGALTSSAIVAGDITNNTITNTQLANLGTAGTLAKFGATGLANSLLSESGAIITHAGTTITTALTELILEQQGDTYGKTRLKLRSRSGSAGALFESDGLDMVDFGFVGNSTVQSNLRMEHRVANLMSSGNTSGEFQMISGATTTPAYNVFFSAGFDRCSIGNDIPTTATAGRLYIPTTYDTRPVISMRYFTANTYGFDFNHDTGTGDLQLQRVSAAPAVTIMQFG